MCHRQVKSHASHKKRQVDAGLCNRCSSTFSKDIYHSHDYVTVTIRNLIILDLSWSFCLLDVSYLSVAHVTGRLHPIKLLFNLARRFTLGELVGTQPPPSCGAATLSPHPAFCHLQYGEARGVLCSFEPPRTHAKLPCRPASPWITVVHC